jgi:hypothetical protein
MGTCQCNSKTLACDSQIICPSTCYFNAKLLFTVLNVLQQEFRANSPIYGCLVISASTIFERSSSENKLKPWVVNNIF